MSHNLKIIFLISINLKLNPILSKQQHREFPLFHESYVHSNSDGRWCLSACSEQKQPDMIKPRKLNINPPPDAVRECRKRTCGCTKFAGFHKRTEEVLEEEVDHRRGPAASVSTLPPWADKMVLVLPGTAGCAAREFIFEWQAFYTCCLHAPGRVAVFYEEETFKRGAGKGVVQEGRRRLFTVLIWADEKQAQNSQWLKK